MKMAQLKEKINSYITTYANIVAVSVLGIFMILQFYTHREILYLDLIHDAKFETNILAKWVSGFEEVNRLGTALNKKIEQKLKKEMRMLMAENNIVKLKILRFNMQTNSWDEVFSANGSFSTVLTNMETRIAAFGSKFLQSEKRVRFNGEGFIIRNSADIGTENNMKLKLVTDVDSNYFIKQQIRATILWAIILTGIGIILLLRDRLLSIRLFKPLDELIAGMKKISQGNLDYRVPVSHRDDLGRFIESFNDMVTELKKSREIMEHELSVIKQQREAIFKVYKDVIYAVTQGKFLLVNIQEVHSYIDDGLKLAEVNISTSKDVGQARQITKQVVYDLFPQYDKINKILLCVSEAATNILKHAGSGQLTIKKIADDSLRFIFNDHGPGMNFDHLPSMLFYKGFSTKISLGCGFNVIYSIVDRMILSTSKNGTTIAFDIIFSNEHCDCPEETVVKPA